MNGDFPGSFTILVDPWLSGPSKIWNSRFAVSHHVVPSCVDSLSKLPTPDLVICSQEKSDHCHETTLRQLHSEGDMIIVGTPAAAKKIRSWKHFDPMSVQPLRRFDPKKKETIFRIAVPPFSPSGSAGEVTIAQLAHKFDIAGLHNAIGITYRPPSSVFSARSQSYMDLPLTPPATPPSSPGPGQIMRPTTPVATTLYPAPYGNREKTLSVLYSPHGCGYELVKAYATSHLLSEAALPLTSLLHSFNRATNPWYFGGNICAGYPDGMEIAHKLYAKTWIGAHDEEKASTGISVRNVRVEKYTAGDIKDSLDSLTTTRSGARSQSHTNVLELDVGKECYIAPKPTKHEES